MKQRLLEWRYSIALFWEIITCNIREPHENSLCSSVPCQQILRTQNFWKPPRRLGPAACAVICVSLLWNTWLQIDVLLRKMYIYIPFSASKCIPYMHFWITGIWPRV